LAPVADSLVVVPLEVVGNVPPVYNFGGFMSTVSVFFHRPRGAYYARCHIPLSLRPLFQGRIECWRGLGTRDKRLASVKASVWNSRIQQLFYTLKLRGHTMDKAQIDGLIFRWMFATLDAYEEDRCDRLPRMDDDEVEDQWTGCSMAFDEAHGALIDGDYASQKTDVDVLLASAELPLLDPHSPAYARLARELLIAKQRVYQVEMERWSGDYRTSLLPSSPSAVPTAVVPAAPPVAPTKLFSEVAELYLKEHHTRSAKTQSTIQSNFTKFLKTIGGDRPIGEVTKEMARAYKGRMVSDQLKAASVNKALKSLSHFVKWCRGKGSLGIRSAILSMVS